MIDDPDELLAVRTEACALMDGQGTAVVVVAITMNNEGRTMMNMRYPPAHQHLVRKCIESIMRGIEDREKHERSAALH